jgi:hypothetical protein
VPGWPRRRTSVRERAGTQAKGHDDISSLKRSGPTGALATEIGHGLEMVANFRDIGGGEVYAEAEARATRSAPVGTALAGTDITRKESE